MNMDWFIYWNMGKLPVATSLKQMTSTPPAIPNPQQSLNASTWEGVEPPKLMEC